MSDAYTTIAPLDTDNPLDDVHHHGNNVVRGLIATFYCGHKGIARSYPVAASLPCCPMCAWVVQAMGHPCYHGRSAT